MERRDDVPLFSFKGGVFSLRLFCISEVFFIEIMGIYCGFIQFDTQYLKDLKIWKSQQQAKERINNFKKTFRGVAR